MARDFRIISADSHVNPPPALYREYAPARFRDRVPRVEDRGDYQVAVFEGQEQRFNLISSVAGRKYEDYKLEARTWEEGLRGGFDPEARLRDQDTDNVRAEVLFGGSMTFKTDDRELKLVLMQAYNDWLADFCKTSPSRLLGVAEIPTWDTDLGAAEARRARSKGLRGVLIPAIPAVEGPWSTPADRNYTDPWYDPLWASLAELAIPAHMHLGARPLTKGLDKNLFVSVTCNKAMMAEPLASLIFSGAFQRHPNLRVVSVESGVGWMAFVIPWMDNVYERHRHWQKLDLPERPSAYFRRNCFGTFIEDPVGVRERHTIGVGNIMWSNDYPHSDSTWPHSMKAIDEHFQDVPDEDVEKICSSNAARLYNL